MIQLDVSELGESQVFSCTRSFSSYVRSDCIMDFNTIPTSTPPNTQPIDFGEIADTHDLTPILTGIYIADPFQVYS